MEEILLKIKDLLKEMLAIIPSLLTAIVVFLVGLVLAKILRRLIGKLLAATGIDHLADRLNDVDLMSKTSFRIRPSSFISGIVYYLILFVFTMAAVEALGMAAISRLMTDIIGYIPKAVSAFFVFLIGILFCDLVKKAVQAAFESLGIRSARLLANIIFYFLFLNVALITMKQAELQTSFMENNISIVLGGVIFAFAIGYGLASKPLMANMLAAFYNRDRFEVGDEITIEERKGTVVNMDNTSLTLRVAEGELIVPLSKLSDHQYVIHRKSRFTPLQDVEAPPEA